MMLLERSRQGSDDLSLGSNIEHMIIDRELSELEEEIIRNPGPLARQVASQALRRGEKTRNS